MTKLERALLTLFVLGTTLFLTPLLYIIVKQTPGLSREESTSFFCGMLFLIMIFVGGAEYLVLRNISLMLGSLIAIGIVIGCITSNIGLSATAITGQICGFFFGLSLFAELVQKKLSLTRYIGECWSDYCWAVYQSVENLINAFRNI